MSRIVGPTLEECYAALRQEYIPGGEPQAYDEVLEPLMEAGVALANRQAPNAPEEVGTQAVLMYVTWMAEFSNASTGPQFAVWQRCGAEAMLAPWTRRGAGRIRGRG